MKPSVLTCIAATLLLAATAVPVSLFAQSSRSNPASSRTVTGTQIGRYKDGLVPVDLSVVPVAAYVPNGSGYTVIAGSGTRTGTFSIPNVPSGSYLLQLGSTYLATASSSVDADFIEDYRGKEVIADPNTTTLTFGLTNLNTWQSTDVLEMVCPNNAFYQTFGTTDGSTSFVGTFPDGGPLSDGSQGDQCYILQLSTQSVAGYPFTAANRGFLVPKFQQQNGTDTQIDGKLSTIAETHSFEANISGADLTAQALAANPNAKLFNTALDLDVYPGSLARGDNTSTSDVILYDARSGQPFITTNGDLGPIAYGNPFPPSSFHLFDFYAWRTRTNYVAPGATNGVLLPAAALGFNTSLPSATRPIKPLIGVVANPRINGGDFFTDQTGVSSTPVLKWSPPTLGTSTYYDVFVFQLSNNGGNSSQTLLATIRTPTTTLQIPQGLLSAGFGYVFRIRPTYLPGLNFAKFPFGNGPVVGVADVLSGMMQP
jgi:hypothetical protein